jgi:hypothetical protein
MPLDLFSKTPVSKNLPLEMQKIINIISNLENKEECLLYIYNLLTKKYKGNRLKTFTKIFEIKEKNIELLWQKNGFLHCTNINYIIRSLLINSALFTESDIKIKWTLIWFFSPHQYLQINTDDKWVNIDIWSHNFGINFGDYSHGFH